MKTVSPVLGDKGISLTKESVETFPLCEIGCGYGLTEEEIKIISESLKC
jgi:hypothetical protein